MSIDVLPDEVLLVIFDFCEAHEDPNAKQDIEAWQSLVHVCKRWRSVVFGSPNRLDLELLCTAITPARDMLGVWPALPLSIQDGGDLEAGLDNIIAGLERSDRVRKINLWPRYLSSSPSERLLAAMLVPFPELTYLELSSDGNGGGVLPDSFLGGSAPRLRFLRLGGIPFPDLPRLLLSATHLVNLHLDSIPHSGYISPETMLTTLSTLKSLEDLRLDFQSPQSRPDRESRHLPPPTRSVLAVLTDFSFKGDSEYLDDLVACIDAPRLNKLYAIFFNQIVFDTPQLMRFICRTPTLKALRNAHVIFDGAATMVNLSSLTSGHDSLRVWISCRELDWQLSSLEQVCTSSLPPLSMLEDLYIYEGPSSRAHWRDNIENELWLELLQPFGAVKNLYLSMEFASLIGPALQKLVGSRATEVLPALKNIFLAGLQPSGRVQEGIRQFVATRQVTGDPIAVSRWRG
jgi:hypothetical protein